LGTNLLVVRDDPAVTKRFSITLDAVDVGEPIINGRITVGDLPVPHSAGCAAGDVRHTYDDLQIFVERAARLRGI